MANIDIKMEDAAYKILSVAKEFNNIKFHGSIAFFREKEDLYGLTDVEITLSIRKLLGAGYLKEITESNEDYVIITDKGNIEYSTQHKKRKLIIRKEKLWFLYPLSLIISGLVAIISLLIAILTYTASQKQQAEPLPKAELEKRVELSKHDILLLLDSLSKTSQHIDTRKKK